MRIGRIILAAWVALFVSLPSTPAQSGAPKSILLMQGDLDPVVIVKGDYGQDQNWLNSMILTVKNTTGKSVLYAEFEVALKGVSDAKGAVTFPMRFGDPKTAETPQPDSDKQIKPEKTAKIRVAWDDYKTMTERLKVAGEQVPRLAMLRLRKVVFADGSRWPEAR